jgi:hypothetical protein
VFFGAPGSLDVDEAAKEAEEAIAVAAAAGIASAPPAAPPGSMAAAAQAAAAAATSGALSAPYAVMAGSTGMPINPFSATTLASGTMAPKVIGSALGSTPIATPASIAAAAAGNPLAAAAAAAAAYSVPGAAAAGNPLAAMTAAAAAAGNPLTAAMASAAAAAAAGATFVDPFWGNPVHKQLATQLLAAKGVPEVHKQCVVVSKCPFGLDEAKMKALMGVAGGWDFCQSMFGRVLVDGVFGGGGCRWMAALGGKAWLSADFAQCFELHLLVRCSIDKQGNPAAPLSLACVTTC